MTAPARRTPGSASRPAVTRTPVDATLIRLATAQHGLVTRAQLRAAGVSQHALQARIGHGMLTPLHCGVYQVGPVAAPRAREWAAVLACPGAVLSHGAAAALWRLLPPPGPGAPLDLTISPERHCGRRPGLKAHRCVLRPGEIRRVEALPVTSPLRTLLDLCAVLSLRELEQALACAEREKLVSRRALIAMLGSCAGRRGIRRLRHLLASGSSPRFTRSPAERRLLDLVRKACLPEPELNVKVAGIELDCYWRQARLAVEVDGRAYQDNALAFLRDRQRDAALAAAGVQVLRLTWRQLVRETEKTLVQLAQALARRQP